jgi:histidine triad (HIT) family protein
MDCIFCKIVKNEIPSYKVFENEHVLAFLDIAPASPGHTLVIPKKHWQNMEDIPEDELQNLILGVKTIGKLLKEKLNIVGYNVLTNNDPVAGQIVPHIHWHIIPRAQDDGLRLLSSGKYKDGEAEEIIKTIIG